MSLSDLVQLLLFTVAKFCYAVVLANQDFLCPAWKIAISLFITSALAALAIPCVFEGFGVGKSSVDY